MDILLDPNVAYLLLVSGLLLTLMALATPGTGLIEIAALLLLVLTGWTLYNLPVNLWAVGVLLVGALPLPFLFRTRKPIYLVLSILALEVGSIYLFQGNGLLPAVNPLLAAFVSVLTAAFYWFVTWKIMEARNARPSHDLETLIGESGEARTDIQAEGSVQVGGELWSARSQEHIPLGAQVRVIGRDGFILEVEAVNHRST